ncbi:MAG: hypothetical protein WAM82_07120 [Thermoanaerobaculia bacterium]
MRPTLRRAAITAVVVASLVPGLVQGRTFNASPRLLSVEAGRDGGFLNAVWSLLADVVTGRVPGTSLVGSPLMAKDTTDPGDNGGRMDPNGATTSSTPPDNGGHLDPNG